VGITNLNKPAVGSTGWGANVNQNFTDIENAFKGTEAGDLFLLNEQGSVPSTPSTGDWKLYFKSDGLYTLGDDGTESGPLGTGGGDFVLISTTTASNDASIEFTSGIDSTYKGYALMVWDTVPATDNTYLQLHVSTNGGSTWESGASDYGWETQYRNWNGDFQSDRNASDSKIVLNSTITGFDWGVGNASGEGMSARVYLSSPASSSVKQWCEYICFGVNSAGNLTRYWGTGMYKTAASYDGIRITFSSGNISSGTFKLYGIK